MVGKAGRVVFEGLYGSESTQQELARRHGGVCIKCGEESPGACGLFVVGKSRRRLFGLVPFGYTTDFVNFTCLQCVNEIHGGDYDWENTNND
jgi:hypothetical protein